MLDPQVIPEEIKSREVELGLRVGLLLLQLFPNGGATDIVFVTVQLFPNGGATDIVFVTLFRIAIGTAITGWDSEGVNILRG